MSETSLEHDDETDSALTGHADVDAVIASLAGLDQASVSDHVAVFEQAHESLRRALSHAGDGAPTGA